MLRKMLRPDDNGNGRTKDQKQLDNVKQRLTKVERRVGHIESQIQVYRRDAK